jgi:mannose-6-phosphate isomerase
LKVLSAAEPLSLQTHPDAAGARAGFEREEARGVARGAGERIYRDPYAKPELIVALTEFDALCGFRDAAESVPLLRDVGAVAIAESVEVHGLAATVAALYRGDLPADDVVTACRGDTAEARLVGELAEAYPHDPSVAVTLLLNRVRLMPGEAAFLGAGNLHAYLSGSGVEIMGASDNVVRGGLTTKHVDVDELLSVVEVTPLLDPVVRATEVAPGWSRYDTPGTPFRLWRLDVHGEMTHTADGRELLLCTDGDVGLLGRGEAGYVARGDTVTLAGRGTVFRIEEVDIASA